MIQIAIDGPSGAGKSTLAKALSKKLGFVYVDTGALYRAIGLFMYRLGLKMGDQESVIKELPNVDVELKYDENGQAVYLCGENVNSQIRLPEISMWASYVSAIPEVRKFLFKIQKNIADNNNVVMDGRDIGTVIMPDAQVKIFLISSSSARAERRFQELSDKGISTNLESVLADINQRDKNDSSRSSAPLKKADDAVILDNSDYEFSETLSKALEIIESKIGKINKE